MLANPISGFLIDGCFLIPSRKAARPIVKENKLSMLYSVGASDHDMSCEDIAPLYQWVPAYPSLSSIDLYTKDTQGMIKSDFRVRSH